MLRYLALLGIAAGLLALAPRAAGGAAEAQPEPWSISQQGVAVLLKAVNPEVTEVTGVPTEPGSRLEFELLVKNVSGNPLMLKVEPLDEPMLRWAVASAEGVSWAPLFAGGKAGGGGSSRKLEPNEVFSYATFKGMAMFAPAGQVGTGCRAMLPAGAYKIAAQDVRLPGITGSFSTNAVTVKVLAADAPVDGLKLSLAAEKSEIALKVDGKEGVPVKLKLTFTNVGAKPLKLNAFNLAWASLSADVELSGSVPAKIEGPKLPARNPPAARAEDYPTLEPGKTWTFEDLAFPGDCGRRHFSRSGPAGAVTCRLRICYKPPAPAAGDKLAEGCWTGKVRSNEVSFSIK
jgi:hypothetical protein